jgi:hypothetical protein
MNYDLIIKLAKLANNNPNDNEANMAARKVCKLLAESNFNFTTHNGDDSRRRPSNPPPPSRSPYHDLEEMVREMNRQKEAQQRRDAENRRAQTEYEESEKRRKKTEWDNPWTHTEYEYWDKNYSDPFDWSDSAERRRAADARKREDDTIKEAREKAKAERERKQRDSDFKKKGWV